MIVDRKYLDVLFLSKQLTKQMHFTASTYAESRLSHDKAYSQKDKDLSETCALFEDKQ